MVYRGGGGGIPNEKVVASDRAAFRVSVMHWRLEVILSTVQYNECFYGFWDSHQQEVSCN